MLKLMDNQDPQPPQASQPQVSAPEPAGQPQPVTSPAPRKNLQPLLVVLVVILIAAGAGVYYWQHQKFNNANLQISNLQSELKNANTKASAYFDFTSLGVKFMPTKSLAGLRYIAIAPAGGSDSGGAYVADANTDAVFNKCQIDSTGSNVSIAADPSTDAFSFAAIQKTQGTYQSAKASAELIKQFNGFYITVSFPNGMTCTGTQADQTAWANVTSVAKQAFVSSLKSSIQQD